MSERPTAPQPRKAPSQERSRSTVDAILIAAERLIGAQGSARVSTRRIAAVAGVSVGSFYQYFPNKQALYVALWRRFTEQILLAYEAAVDASVRLPLSEAIRVVVRAELGVRQRDLTLHRVLSTEVRPLLPAALTAQLDEVVIRHTRRGLEARGDLRAGADHDMQAFILVKAISAVYAAALEERPAYLASDAFVEEVVRLALGILDGAGGGRGERVETR